MRNESLTQARLKEVLRYSPDTGVFKRRGEGPHAGRTYTQRSTEGYIRVTVDGRAYGAHRLAWLYMTGAWPKAMVDHKNGDRADNRWRNLREATHSQNTQNQRRPQQKNPYLGVTHRARRGKWEAWIRVNGVKTYIGIFHSPEEAHAAYVKAKREHHPFNTL